MNCLYFTWIDRYYFNSHYFNSLFWLPLKTWLINRSRLSEVLSTRRIPPEIWIYHWISTDSLWMIKLYRTHWRYVVGLSRHTVYSSLILNATFPSFVCFHCYEDRKNFTQWGTFCYYYFTIHQHYWAKSNFLQRNVAFS